MRSFIQRHNYAFILILIFLLAECLVNPLGNFPLNDDWCYGKAVKLSAEGEFTIGGFGAMTLASHIVWGMLFVKIFGFSFTVLRLSTLISSIIGILVLNHLVFRITANRIVAFVSALTLCFNPFYFNLSNTYMTDVNFNTLLVLCCYTAFLFFETRKPLYLLLFALLSGILVLVRQLGIVVPASFLVACVFLSGKQRWHVVSGLFVFLFVFGLLKIYEVYIVRILPPYAAYKFSNDIHITDPEFWKGFIYRWELRFKPVLTYLLMLAAPIAVIYLPGILKRLKVYQTILVMLFSAGITFYAVSDVTTFIGNLMGDMWLGPDTFYSNLKSGSVHISSVHFLKVLCVLKFLLSFLSCVTFAGSVVIFFKRDRVEWKMSPFVVLCAAILFSYTCFLFIPDSFFDRYIIPLSTLAIFLVVSNRDLIPSKYLLSLAPLLLIAYIAIAGTKDYLTVNRSKWELYNQLKTENGAGADKINGGFEINCWNDGAPSWWSDFFTTDPYDYLIDYTPAPGFEVMREKSFHRYFPFREDKMYIYKKTDQPAEIK